MVTLKEFKDILDKYDLYDTKELNEVLYDHKHHKCPTLAPCEDCNKYKRKIKELKEKLKEFNFILSKYKFDDLTRLNVFINKYYDHKCPELTSDNCSHINPCKNENCDNYDEENDNEACDDCVNMEIQRIIKELSEHNIKSSNDLTNFFKEFENYYEKLNSMNVEGFDDLIDKYQNEIYNKKEKIEYMNKPIKLRHNIQTKFDIFKRKYKNNKLNKDIEFIFNSKKRIFKCKENLSQNKMKIKIDKRHKVFIDFKNKYMEKYKDRLVTEKDVDESRIKKRIIENEEYHKKYDNNRKLSDERLNKVFEDFPKVEIDKKEINRKFKDMNLKERIKTVKYTFRDINKDLYLLEKEYNNFKIVENYYNKLKNDETITNVFKNNSNKISELFSEYEKNKLNEYTLLSQIGGLFLNNKLSKQEIKEINSIQENTRPARLIKQCKRVFLLEEYIPLKNIMHAGISNWLRDTSDYNFEILLSLLAK